MGGGGGLDLELPGRVEIRVERGGGSVCRVDLNPLRERELDSYTFYLVGESYSEASKLAEVKPGLDIVLECSGPAGECRCLGEDCDVVRRVEAFGWDEFWEEIADREVMVLVSTRWVGGCGLNTRVYVWPPDRIVVSHDDVFYQGVHVVHLDLEKLAEKLGARRS